MRIRRADASDAQAVCRLIESLEQREFDFPSFNQLYAENLADPNVYYCVADADGEVAGFISLHVQRLLHHASRIGEIQELIVKEGLRGRGYGAQLFDAAVGIAREKGCAQVEVCCNQSRDDSHRFYRSRGMQNHHFKFTLPLR